MTRLDQASTYIMRNKKALGVLESVSVKEFLRLLNFNRYFTRLLTLLSLFVPGVTFGMASDWDENEHVKVRIVSAVEAVGDLETISLGLHFKLKSGWKIYWRSPGDAGIPPEQNWTGSENLKGTNVSWPMPRRFSVLGLETLGYSNEVVLPLVANLAQVGQPLRLKSNINYLACEEICIPYQAKVALDVPSGPAKPSELAQLIDIYAARVPGAGDRHGLLIVKTVLLQGGEGPKVQIEARSERPFVGPDVFVEGPYEVVFGKPQVALSGDRRRAVLSVKGSGLKPDELEGADVIITLVDKDRAMETAVNLQFGEPIEGPSVNVAISPPLWHILLYAILGGVILNLMPCVLPVLSIKLLSVVSYGGRKEINVRFGFMATAAGVVSSMLLIAMALIGLKTIGMSIGWGIQFQQPLFLAFIALVVALFAYNLFGLFEIHLPQRLSGMSLRASERPAAAGHFLTGAFVTLLATPCSAPFVGTAVGFALSRQTAEIVPVFFALGVGLALPYLVVAAFPRLATALPRPGAWMNVLRRVMGVALVVTVVWLINVISVQIGVEGAYVLAAMLVLIGVVLLTQRLTGSRLGRHAVKAAIVLSIATLAVPVFHGPTTSIIEDSDTGRWRTFDRAEINRFVAQGKTVFVDITADWCITCQVNKRVVLDTRPVGCWLDGNDVVAMRADWTRPNQEIANYLASFNRFGIPFNAIFGPDAPKGIILPELLTRKIILQAAIKSNKESEFTSC